MSHWMIQPTDWDREPDSMVGQWPDAWVALYRLIWTTTEACCFKPPLLTHYRSVAQVPDGPTLAMASCNPPESRQGYWRFRQDYPRFPWPLSAATPPLPPLHEGVLTRAAVVVHTPTLSDLLGDADLGGWLSPASAAGQLQGLFESTPPLLQAISPSAPLALTDAGRAVLLDPYADQGSALDRVKSRLSTLDELEDGRLTTLEALAAAEVDEATSLAGAIEVIVDTWSGSSRESVMAQQGSVAITPPAVALPADIDPERHLPTDHPLRALRMTMEQSLAEDPAWLVLPRQDQAIRRLARLRASDVPALVGLFAGDWRYNAVALWLVGVSADEARRLAD